MKKSFPIVPVLMLLSIPSAFAQQAASAGTDEAARRVMEHWVGEWSGGVAGDSDAAVPHIAATPDRAKVAWTLDNHFLRGTNFVKGDNPVGEWLMRYSTKTRKYQVWFFSAKGDASVWDGTWDDAKQTMNWKTSNPETGATGSGHTTFAEGKQEWMLSVTQDGKTTQGSGSLKRK